jgi:hypothetical protein
MPGRAALTNIEAVRSDIRSIQMTGNPSGAGDSMGEYSEIGNDGRKGSDAYGSLTDPTYLRVDAEILGKPRAGLATSGEQGIGTDGTEADYKNSRNAQGITYHGGSGRRAQD